jgi:hypothetical protein
VSTAVCEKCPRLVMWSATRGSAIRDVRCGACASPVRSIINFAIRRIHGGGYRLQCKPVKPGDRVEYLARTGERGSSWAWRSAVIEQSDSYGLFARDLETHDRVVRDALRWPLIEGPDAKKD